MYLNSSALEVTWEHPICDYGIRRGYTVSLLTQSYSIISHHVLMPSHQVTHGPLPAPLDPPGVQGFPESPHNLSAGDTQLIITNLTPNTNYSITVCAFTSIGCGLLSHIMNQTNEDGKAISKCKQ